MKLAYLGPPGTYSEQAALAVEGAALIPFGTIPAAVRAVEDGTADAAVVSVENSLEGAVTQTADILIHHTELRIRREIVLQIHHCLLTQPGVAPRDVSVIYSHPQALAQCRAYVVRNLPGAEPVASLSTAAAVSDMRNSDRPAAPYRASGRRSCSTRSWRTVTSRTCTGSRPGPRCSRCWGLTRAFDDGLRSPIAACGLSGPSSPP